MNATDKTQATQIIECGTILTVKGARVSADNGRFVVVASHADGSVFWKRLKRNNEWAAGGNVSKNFRGESAPTLQSWIDAGIARIDGAVDGEFARTYR